MSRAGFRNANDSDGGSCSFVDDGGAVARNRTMGDKLVDNGCCTEAWSVHATQKPGRTTYKFLAVDNPTARMRILISLATVWVRREDVDRPLS